MKDSNIGSFPKPVDASDSTDASPSAYIMLNARFQLNCELYPVTLLYLKFQPTDCLFG